MSFAMITITPVKNNNSTETDYEFTVEADSTSVGLWTRHVRYPTEDAPLGSFSPRLNPKLKAHIRELLSRGEPETFSWENVFDGFGD